MLHRILIRRYFVNHTRFVLFTVSAIILQIESKFESGKCYESLVISVEIILPFTSLVSVLPFEYVKNTMLYNENTLFSLYFKIFYRFRIHL